MSDRTGDFVPAAVLLTPRRDEEESVDLDGRPGSPGLDLDDRSNASLRSASSSALLQLQSDDTEALVHKYKSRQWTWQHVQQPRWWAATLWRQKGTFVCVLVLLVIMLLLGLLVDEWNELPWQAWYAVSVTLLTFILLVRNDMDPALTMMFSMALLLAPNVLSPSEALKGFSSSGVFTIAVLFVCARGVSDSGVLDVLINKFFPRQSRLIVGMCMLFIPISLLSGFIANTPLVAMCIPLVENYARTRGIPVSKLFIPLSYSAILGGTLTMIGTSTNLVVQGLAQSRDPSLEFPFFLVGIIGAPILAIGLTYTILVGQLDWMLPVRKSAMSSTLSNASAHFVSMRVKEGSQVIGKSIEEARLRHLHGVYLVEIERAGECLSAPSPDFVLREGDLLLFTGDVRDVGDLFRISGLAPTHEEQVILSSYTRILVEAVVAGHSQLVGRTLKEVNFRSQFDAGVISIYRHGEDLKGKIGSIPLASGDALLMVCKPTFIKFRSTSDEFLVVRQIGDAPIVFPRWQMIVAPTLQLLLIVFASIPYETLETFLLNIALLTMFLMYFTRCVTWASIRDAVNIPIMVTIMASFAMSDALEKWGVASVLSDNLVFLTSWMGEFGIYLGVYLSTMLLTALLSNASSAAIMVPIAFGIAEQGEVSHGVRPLLYVIMTAASADFSTPIGYQTNLMVWNAGGYKFLDYTRFGLPLQIVLAFTTCLVVILAGDILGSPDLTPTNSLLCTLNTATCKICSYSFKLAMPNWNFTMWPAYPGNNITNSSLISNATFCQTFVPPYRFSC